MCNNLNHKCNKLMPNHKITNQMHLIWKVPKVIALQSLDMIQTKQRTLAAGTILSAGKCPAIRSVLSYQE